MVYANTINISGEAADNIIISLAVNDELQAVVLPEKGKFNFENVELDYGENEILVRGLDTKGNSIVLEKITTTCGSPRLDFLARNVMRGNPARNKIALTFDGGWGNGVAEAILNYLKGKKVRSTMFLAGPFLRNYPELVNRMIQDGHEVANHTWSHPHLTSFAANKLHQTLPTISRELLQEEIKKTSELYTKITGQPMTLFWRAPYGEHNLEIRRWAAEIGYTQIGWTMGNGENMDTMDWVADTTSASYKSPAEILDKLLKFGNGSAEGASGGIILMHLDTSRSKDQPYIIIPALIDSLRNRGYEFVRVSELL